MEQYTQEQLQRHGEIIKLWEESGKSIQLQTKENHDTDWADLKCEPSFNVLNGCKYRVKP
jgi:hypothetical protein